MSVESSPSSLGSGRATIAELELVIEEGAKKAFEDLRPITTEDILSAIQENPPRLNEAAIEEHKKRIGFI